MQNDELRLVLFTSQSIVVKLDEFVRIFRHRNVLLYYFVPISILALSNVRGGPSEIPMWFSLSVYMFGTFVMILALLLQVAVLRWVIRRPPILTVHLTPVMILSICCSTFVGEFIVQAYIGVMPNTLFQFAMLVGFYLIVTELQFAIAAQFIVPSVLRELRGRETKPKGWMLRMAWSRLDALMGGSAATNKGTGQETAVSLAKPVLAQTAKPKAALPKSPAAPVSLPELSKQMRDPAAQGPKITVKDLSLPAADVLHIEAEGNYTIIHTAKRRHQILMRFAQVLAQMPDGMGLQVHRSHWVAIGAIKGHRRAGRDIVVTLVTGAEITVAQSRQAELLPRLRALVPQNRN